jgi:hypothetical protein
MGGTMQSFDITDKKTEARPHRRNTTIVCALFSVPNSTRLGNSGLPPRVFFKHLGTHASTG